MLPSLFAVFIKIVICQSIYAEINLFKYKPISSLFYWIIVQHFLIPDTV